MSNRYYRFICSFLATILALALLHQHCLTARQTHEVTLELVGQVGGHIGDVAIRGDYAFVGEGQRLMVLDISDLTNPMIAGATPPFLGFVESVTVNSTMAFVAAGNSGVHFIDVSNPINPTVLGSYDTPGYAEGIVAKEQYAYVADGPYGLRVLDVSDPAHPTGIGSAYAMAFVFDVFAESQYVYLAAAGGGFLVADISNPAHPIETGSYDTLGYAYGVALVENKAYIADGWKGLRIVDVSNSEDPHKIGFYDTSGWALDVAMIADTAYVADGFALRVIDVLSPSKLAELGSYEAKGPVEKVFVDGSIVYITDRENGLRIVDVSNKSSPTEIGSYSPLGYAANVTVSGNYAYVAAGYYGLRIVDASNPSNLREVGRYETVDFADAVSVVGNYAYVPTTYEGLHIVDISNPIDPTRSSYYQPPGGGGRDVVVSNGIAYYVDEGGLALIDVSDPSNPFQTGYIVTLESTTDNRAHDVDISGSLAYVVQAGSGIKVVDVSNQQNPSLIGTFQTGARFNDIAVLGDVAYVATSNAELLVLDVSNPASPNVIGTFETHGGILGVTAEGSTAYLSIGKLGIVAVDVSDPFNPALAGEYNTPGFCRRALADDNRVYVADGNAGLVILETNALDGLKKQIPHTSDKRVVSYPRASRNNSLQRRKSPTVPTRAERHLATNMPKSVGAEGDILVVTQTGDSGAGSLRSFLENAQPGDIITFSSLAFPIDNPGTISLTSALPHITQESITIDASNAGVIITGESLSGDLSGFVIQSNRNVLKGLQILSFPEDGLIINGNDNIIGGDRDVGDGPTGEGNVISGNGCNGISIGGSGNAFAGNLIGTDATGTEEFGNGCNGIELGGQDIRFGGDGSISQKNVISGNDYNGIKLMGKSNTVIGNLIGTDITGTKELGNAINGIWIGGQENMVGGAESREGNIISGNGNCGIFITKDSNSIVGNYIGTDISGSFALGNHVIGLFFERGAFNNIAKGNVISGNADHDIHVMDSFNTIIGNVVGLDASGANALGFAQELNLGASYNRLGGTSAEERNLIGSGVGVSGHNQIVIGNYIGTDITGMQSIGNNSYGVDCADEHSFIGGAAPEERNVIAGNNRGITFRNGAEHYFVTGNYIGTDPSGTEAVGNLDVGIHISGGSSNYIGPGNVIINSGSAGIYVLGSVSTGNTITRNRISNSGGIGIELMRGGNTELASPMITKAAPFLVLGTAPRNSTVEIFSDTKGEGMTYEGMTKSDDLGDFSFSIDESLAGLMVTATATDSDGNTSEFSGFSIVESKGDVNGDGYVDLADAMIVLRSLSGYNASDTTIKEADVNGDNMIGMEEALYIVQQVSGLH